MVEISGQIIPTSGDLSEIQIGNIIAAGGMSKVYDGIEKINGTEREVAVKILGGEKIQEIELTFETLSNLVNQEITHENVGSFDLVKYFNENSSEDRSFDENIASVFGRENILQVPRSFREFLASSHAQKVSTEQGNGSLLGNSSIRFVYETTPGVDNQILHPVLISDKFPDGTMDFYDWMDGLVNTKEQRIDSVITFLEGLKQIAEDLEILHGENIIHRDIKPGNIMVLPNGKFVLTDFGNSLIGDITLNEAPFTPNYVANERFKAGSAGLVIKSDHFSMMASIAEMMLKIGSVHTNKEALYRFYPNKINIQAAVQNNSNLIVSNIIQNQGESELVHTFPEWIKSNLGLNDTHADEVYELLKVGLSVDPDNRPDSLVEQIDSLIEIFKRNSTNPMHKQNEEVIQPIEEGQERNSLLSTISKIAGSILRRK